MIRLLLSVISVRSGSSFRSRLASGLAALLAQAVCFASPGAELSVAVEPVNYDINVTLLRCSPPATAKLESLQACKGISGVLRLLKKPGKAEVLFRGRRTFCAPAPGEASFVSVERRPNLTLDGKDSDLPARNRSYGLDLHVQAQPWGSGSNSTPMLVAFWGTWSGSSQLLFQWEALAVRAFNAGAAVPGLSYTKVEEDEDGFVNTGGTSSLRGLFGRKSKKQPVADSNDSAPATPPSGEPDYLIATDYEKVDFKGEWLVTPGGMIIVREQLKQAKTPGELYLIIEP